MTYSRDEPVPSSSLYTNMVFSLLAKQGKAVGLQGGTRLMAATLAWKDQGLFLCFWSGFFLATRGQRPWGPGSTSWCSLKVQFHITTSVMVVLVKSAKVQQFMPSLLPKTRPMAGHCLLGCTGTSRQGSEQRRWAQTSSAAEGHCVQTYTLGILFQDYSLPANCKAKSCPIFCSVLRVRLRTAED